MVCVLVDINRFEWGGDQFGQCDGIERWKDVTYDGMLMLVLPRTLLPWKELQATPRHGFSQLILPKGFVLKYNFSFVIHNKVCHQVFWRSLPIQPIAIWLAILKKVQWSHGRTFEFRGNSFSSLLSFTLTPTFQVLMLQKLLLLFSKGANPSPGASPVFLTVTQVKQYTCIAGSALCTGNYDLYILVTQVSNASQ